MYSCLRPLLFALPPETSHDLTLAALRYGAANFLRVDIPDRPVHAMGLRFPNPVGLAAGLDKNGECISGLGKLGFGFIEVGTVTPRPQSGNPKPRLFRLPETNAIINRMGFNNKGVAHLSAAVQQSDFQGILGVNIGKNRDTPVEAATSDYLYCLDRIHGVASYVVVNISSPNTPDLRSLQHGEALDRMLDALRERQTSLDQRAGRRVPLVVKIAPDNTDADIEAMAAAFIRHGVDGVIAGNTTVSRQGIEGHSLAGEAGGLSGAPLKSLADHALTVMVRALQDRIPVMGVGGILSPADALDKHQAGATLVQLYTGLIYKGPTLVADVARAWPCATQEP